MLPEFEMATLRELIVGRFRLIYELTDVITIIAFRPGEVPLLRDTERTSDA
jgi:hypothetical protein